MTPVSEFRKLSFAEWDAAGFPTPEHAPEGFGKLTWSPEIALFTDFATPAADVLDLAGWASFDFPTPVAQQRYANDEFYFATVGDPEISYTGPTYTGPITYGQWEAAGFPTPTPANPCPPGAGVSPSC